MVGDKGGPEEGMGNGFLRSKAHRRGADGLMVFIPELLPVIRPENGISIVVEGGDKERPDHGWQT